MSEQASQCEKCRGLGFTFKERSREYRIQIKCPYCDGTGRLEVSVARILSGEVEQAREHPEAMNKEAKFG